MPEFTPNARQRIVEAVRVVERMTSGGAVGFNPGGDETALQVAEVTAYDAAKKTGTGKLCRWNAAASNGDGDYTADANVTLTIRDALSKAPKVGDKILCRLLGTDKGTAWEPIGGGVEGDTYTWTLITVVTDVRVDATTMKLQKKTVNILARKDGVESGWIDFHTGTACPPSGSPPSGG